MSPFGLLDARPSAVSEGVSMTSSRIPSFLAGAVLATLGAGALTLGASDHRSGAASTPAAPAVDQPTLRNTSNNDSAKQVYDGAKESVVFVSAQSSQGQGTGSGFVVSADGKIVTNQHVVDGAEQVTVRIGTGGEEQPATVLAADASKDLALLQVDTGGAELPALSLGDSSAVGVGDPVFAIGNPYGLDHTLTSGIVSALDRDIQAPDGTPISGAIQTDAVGVTGSRPIVSLRMTLVVTTWLGTISRAPSAVRLATAATSTRPVSSRAGTFSPAAYPAPMTPIFLIFILVSWLNPFKRG